jgi:hypothetical protein
MGKCPEVNQCVNGENIRFVTRGRPKETNYLVLAYSGHAKNKPPMLVVLWPNQFVCGKIMFNHSRLSIPSPDGVKFSRQREFFRRVLV